MKQLAIAGLVVGCLILIMTTAETQLRKYTMLYSIYLNYSFLYHTLTIVRLFNW